MDCFVTDKIGHAMNIDTSEKLKIIEPYTYEECFPFEGETVFCYFKGEYEDCKKFISELSLELQECLDIYKISK